MEISNFATMEGTSSYLPPLTISGMSKCSVLNRWKNQGVSRGLFCVGGRDSSESTIYMGSREAGSSRNWRRVAPVIYASYRGGRNESYAYGVDRQSS